MTTLREAAQQALEFVRWSQYVPCQSEAFPEPPSTAPQVEAALKAALAEPVQKPLSIEQIEEAWDQSNFTGRANISFARAIERAHGITNE